MNESIEELLRDGGRTMNKPVAASTDQLLAYLDDIRARVASHDSFEGSIEYLMPTPDEAEGNPDCHFMVRGAWRIGNSQGQGGMRMVGTIA